MKTVDFSRSINNFEISKINHFFLRFLSSLGILRSRSNEIFSDAWKYQAMKKKTNNFFVFLVAIKWFRKFL